MRSEGDRTLEQSLEEFDSKIVLGKIDKLGQGAISEAKISSSLSWSRDEEALRCTPLS